MHVLDQWGAGLSARRPQSALLKRGDSVSVIDVFGYGYDPARKDTNAGCFVNIRASDSTGGDIPMLNCSHRFFEDNCPDVVVHLAVLEQVSAPSARTRFHADINITGTP